MENGYLDHGYEEPHLPYPNHKRSLSGGILARLPFLRSSLEEQNPNQHYANNFTPDTGDTSTSTSKNLRSRKRKGSLRKTALLGTGKRRLERRSSKSNSNDLNRSPQHCRNAGEYSRDSMETVRGGQNGVVRSSSRRFSFEEEESTYAGSSTTTTSSSNWTSLTEPPPLGIDITTTLKEDLHQSPPSSVTSPITSHPYASTTSDDDGLTLSTQPSLQPPPTPHPPRTRSSRSGAPHPSTAAPPLRSAAPSAAQHDYAETEWWGWTILALTWIVFVVGMGSCLGVWSWAWDVGETPYAPPELEDDPTLPIVGYYPALIVLTGVAAWVWVVVAWVGMKYFRHARVWDGDD